MDWIDKEIKNIVERYKSTDPEEILKGKDIDIIPFELGSCWAYKITDRRCTVILINQNLQQGYRRFILAHELGHVVLHKTENTTFYLKNNIGNVPKIEREANEFATKLLLLDYKTKEDDTTYSVLRENGIPYENERFLE